MQLSPFLGEIKSNILCLAPFYRKRDVTDKWQRNQLPSSIKTYMNTFLTFTTLHICNQQPMSRPSKQIYTTYILPRMIFWEAINMISQKNVTSRIIQYVYISWKINQIFFTPQLQPKHSRLKTVQHLVDQFVGLHQMNVWVYNNRLKINVCELSYVLHIHTKLLITRCCT